MVDPSSSSSHSSHYSSSFLPNLITQSTTHQPSSLLSATTQLSSNSSNSTKTQPRSTTPSRYLNSGSPLPPTSAYALVSSTRSLETPTSDIRATSPTAQLGSSSSNQDQEDHQFHLNSNWSHPRNSHLSSTSNFDFCHPSAPPPQASIDHHDEASRPFMPSGSVKPSSSIYVNPPTPNQLNSQLDCFWAILDRELKFIYVDPKLQRELEGHSDQILSTSIYNYIHPADLDGVMPELDYERLGYESSQLRPQNPRMMQSSPTLPSCDPKPLNQHRVIESHTVKT
ncbi:uncharacterized protein MELLADRAFT_62443 [Melampsora larici-populina 98AG31]|uniref:PAS domain-containing protein n=1 Tax=Melampsora larici-populina (strain 98AG31 / pathotype 3-4-7) TaxID=747676 RepID=F4RIZ8_MELLP|nr:uncharacterized protein MELLADRAFT_62443 [Melampsora larici-populina 98AG31]EGG07742.1 hypothetical protein MELLADRAFT_62443 [Melampsora larici-populina 98AG31]